MKRVYLIRHGESTANLAHIHGGPHHQLTERGVAQAQTIGERCSKLNIKALFASDIVRAQQTAGVIAERVGLPLQTSELFREIRGPSIYEEQRADDPAIIKSFYEINKQWSHDYRHSDEENFGEILARANAALDFLASRPEDIVAVVSHELFMRLLVARAILGPELTPYECLRFFYSVKHLNTGLTALEYNPLTKAEDESPFPWRLITWNDHAHLG